MKIFKTLALAMMMPAMLLTASCSSDDNFVNTENTNETTAKQGYTLPVTVSVTRQGDEATTRATYDDDTKTLAFSTGDKLFVTGTDNSDGGAGQFAGTLDYVSDGTFSGTISTENEYTGTADALLTSASSATATLLPSGYAEDYEFLSVSGDGYSATLSTDATKAFATSKAAAVEQLSLEQANDYDDGFALAPQNAILNFTIKGLAANIEVAVNFTGDGTISKNVTTDRDSTATFAIGVADGKDLNDCSLTVGDNAITLVSSSKTLAAGKIYNITRAIVTWNTTNVFNESNQSDVVSAWASDPLTYEGITISFSGTGVSSRFNCYDIEEGTGHLECFGDDGDSFTFTAPSGKKFTRIEMTDEDGTGAVCGDDNWSLIEDDTKLVWSGTPSNTVTIAGDDLTELEKLISIVFTLVDE